MRCLMLLRHAKAIPADAAVPDAERWLEPRGRDEAAAMGAYMVRHGLLPDQVLASTAKRTRESWELAAAAFSPQPPAIYDQRLYEANPQGIFNVVREVDDAVRSLLVIGHNPALHELALQLIAAGDVDARERLREELPTTGLVTIDFPFDDWKKLHIHAGRLSHFVTPHSLTLATD